MIHQRKRLIVANWKMHLNVHEASRLVHHLDKLIKIHRGIEVVLAPTALAMQPLSLEIDRRKFRLAAQDAHYEDAGPYTGEVSFTMLRDLVHYSLVGHSGRRIYFGESLETIQKKTYAAVRNGITPILCVGETLQERRAGESKQVVHDQLTSALAQLTSAQIEDVVIAYEPVWAISTFDGVLAKPHEVQKEMDFVRHQIQELYGEKAAKAVRVLYGGSVDDQDVRGYLEISGCDGVLVGAASLSQYKFAGIVDAAYRLQTERKELSHGHAA